MRLTILGCIILLLSCSDTVSNEAPVEIKFTSNAVAVALPETRIGTFETVDPDQDTGFSYALISGEGDTHNDQFKIVNNEIFTKVKMNSGKKFFRVKTTDKDGLSFEKAFTIEINGDLPPEPERIFKNLKRGNAEKFTYFSFSKNDTVDVSDPKNDTSWDIAFGVANTYYAAIITNSGVSGSGQGGAISYKDTLYDDVKSVPNQVFETDKIENEKLAPAIPLGSKNSWYTYNSQTHKIEINPRHTIIVRTADGKYAKVFITSYYYINADGTKDMTKSRYFTFKYLYQPDSQSKRLSHDL